MSFQRTRRKGDIGERIILRYFEGHVVYKAINEDCPHPIDYFVLALKGEYKNEIIAADAKAKPRRELHGDTGINEKHYDTYYRLSMKYRMPVFLFFVDEAMARVYGNYLEELVKPDVFRGRDYPRIEICRSGPIKFFSMNRMLIIGELTADECNELRALRVSNYQPPYRHPMLPFGGDNCK